MLEHGIAVRLSPRVRRIVAPNPGIMTGAGTNTYLLGGDAVAVLDPGPALPRHVDAILRTAGDRIRWIVCTHTHRDHSPAWAALAAATGADVIGAMPSDDIAQDASFSPTREPVDGGRLRTGEFTLRAIHTPGHVGNHFCFFLEEEGMLFSGDHIMNGSTVVIIPPSGDMHAYIQSLHRLRQYPLRWIAPGHGELIEDAMPAVDGLVQHRLRREAKVISSLQRVGRCSVTELVRVVYDDVSTSLHKIAVLSMTAHLIKLQRESRVRLYPEDGTWELLDR